MSEETSNEYSEFQRCPYTSVHIIKVIVFVSIFIIFNLSAIMLYFHKKKLLILPGIKRPLLTSVNRIEGSTQTDDSNVTQKSEKCKAQIIGYIDSLEKYTALAYRFAMDPKYANNHVLILLENKRNLKSKPGEAAISFEKPKKDDDALESIKIDLSSQPAAKKKVTFLV